MTWSPVRVDMLKVLWDQGLLVGDIAERLGASRSAVVAKAHRLGLERKMANAAPAEQFERVIDIVTNAPLGNPVTVRRAAVQVGLPVNVAQEMWGAFCGRVDPLSAALDRPVA